MTTPNLVDNIVVQAINNTEPPADKAKSLVQVLTLSAGVPVEQDFSLLINRQEIHGGIRAIYIDNSAGTSGLSISTLAMGTVIVPAGYQGVIPLFMSGDNAIYFTGAGTVKYAVSNTDTSFHLWPTSGGAVSSFGNNTDIVPSSSGVQGADSFLYGLDVSGSMWRRLSINPGSPASSISAANAVNALLVDAVCGGVGAAGIFQPASCFNANVDAIGASTPGIFAQAENLNFNGASWDRQRGNMDTAALITLATQGVGTVNSADQTNYNGRGVNLVIDLTAVAAGSLTVTIQGKDIASGKYYTILSSAALTAVATTLLSAYPGNAAVANASIALPLPRTWRVSATNTAGTVTGTIGASVIV